MTKQLRILLVEDNPGDADLVGEMLTIEGRVLFDFKHARSMADALKCIESDSYDIILLDLGLPDSSGLDSIRSVRCCTATPIVVLTGSNDEHLGVAAIQEGAQDYVVKGWTSGEFLKRIILFALERHHIRVRLGESGLFLRSILNALPSNIAILNTSGNIVMVNRAWREFANLNGGSLSSVCEGTDYLKVCEASEDGMVFAGGLSQVLSGEKDFFEMEYPCHSQDENRWFNGTVTRFVSEASSFAVVAHENITGRVRRTEKIKSQLEELQRWQEVMLDREDRVMELKHEVNDLCRRAGEQARYPSQANDLADSTGL